MTESVATEPAETSFHFPKAPSGLIGRESRRSSVSAREVMRVANRSAEKGRVMAKANR